MVSIWVGGVIMMMVSIWVGGVCARWDKIVPSVTWSWLDTDKHLLMMTMNHEDEKIWKAQASVCYDMQTQQYVDP